MCPGVARRSRSGSIRRGVALLGHARRSARCGRAVEVWRGAAAHGLGRVSSRGGHGDAGFGLDRQHPGEDRRGGQDVAWPGLGRRVRVRRS